MAEAEIGIFGGSGFYEFLDHVQEVEVATPFGAPSAPPVVGEVGGKSVAFLPRHGRRHELPPAQINYRACCCLDRLKKRPKASGVTHRMD